MKTLVISPQPFFSPRGTPLSVYYRTAVASQLGASIDLLTYGEGQDVDLPGVRIIRIPRFRWLGKVRVGPSALKFFLDGFVLVWTIGLLIRHRYEVVHAHEESVFFARFLKRIFGYKLIYDMHSSLPQQLVNFGFSRSKLLIRVFERLENGALARADAVITICPDLAEYAAPRMPDGRRHFLIENSLFDPVRLIGSNEADHALDPAATPPERLLVLYAGTFEKYQGLEILIPAFARARERCPGAFLLLIGGQPQQIERLRALAGAHGVGEHCHFTGQISRELVKRYTERAVVQTSPRISGTNTPLKVYEQLASGIPLLATRVYSHTQVLDDRVCFLAEPTEEGLAEGLVAALTDRDRRREVAAAAQELYRQKYSRVVYERKMSQLLEALR
jgi:glycosyltransferase involved in cell wall biosynthesis